jgi:hypothetical protein
MAKEKNWEAVAPVSFTADGQANGVITVEDTCKFRAKQIVRIGSDTQSIQEFEVRTVLSETEMTVGKKGTRFDCLEDMTPFLVADNAEVSALQQLRPKISPDETLRYSYEEEPIVARRSVLVDQLGRVVKFIDGKLPIEGEISVGISAKKTPTIINIPVVNKDTQETIIIPSNVVEFELRIRDRASLQYSFVDGQTNTVFATLKAGGVYRESNLELDNALNLYVESNKNNITIELKYWTK